MADFILGFAAGLLLFAVIVLGLVLVLFVIMFFLDLLLDTFVSVVEKIQTITRR